MKYKINRSQFRDLVAKVLVEEMRLNEFQTMGQSVEERDPRKKAQSTISQVAKGAVEAGNKDLATKVIDDDKLVDKMAELNKKEKKGQLSTTTLAETESPEDEDVPEDLADAIIKQIEELEAMGLDPETIDQLMDEFIEELAAEQG